MARKREIIAENKRKTRKIILPNYFSAQLDLYIAYCVERNLKQTTVDSYVFYLEYLRKYLTNQNHSLLVDEIEESDIKGFLDYLRKVKKNTQPTINSAIASIRPFFTFLTMKQKLLARNPMEDIQKGKTDSKPILPFSKYDLTMLLNEPSRSTYVGYRDYCIMLVLLSNGMRISECVSLRLMDIDFKDNKIIILKTKNRTGRIVGLSTKVKSELQKFIRLCHKESKSTDFLFMNQDGGQLAIRTIQENLKEYGIRAKIDPQKRVSPHTFRHTYAIYYLKNGGSTASLREQLGHLTIETVEKYLFWSTDDKLEEFQKYNPVDNMIL